MSLLFNRKVGLLVYTPSKNALDLSNMRISFSVTQSDYETPNAAIIRVYNLKPETAQLVKGEYQRVSLQAGYDYPNGYGIIFDGTIKQVLFGHENNVDSYVDILAADGDEAYTNSKINQILAAPHTQTDVLNAVSASMNLPKGFVMDIPATVAGRNKVLYGMSRDHMRDLAKSVNASWSIQNGKITLISLTSFRPDVAAVVLNSRTGLVGFPEQTPGGINITCLLNPKIRIGGLVQVEAEDINQGFVTTSGPLLRAPMRLETMKANIAQLSGAGFYKVLVVEYEGDTRGDPWYSKLVCLAVDRSAPAGQEVKPYSASSQVFGQVTLGQPQWGQ